MNKYTALGVVTCARSVASRYLVVSDGEAATTAAFGAVSITAAASASRIRRTNGAQRIDFPNGSSIMFVNRRSRGHRGVSVDTVLLDEWVPTDDQLADIAPCIQAARGEIVRA